MSTDELDMPCRVCGDPIGDHPMRLWLEHTRGGTELPYETIPKEGLSAAFGLDCPIADHVDVRSMVALHDRLGPLALLEMTWQIGDPISGPTPVTKLAFLGEPDGLRSLGRLLRDSANGAANAAEKAGRR
jgi:hypothetical protein